MYIDDLVSKHLDAHLQNFIGALRFVRPDDEELRAFYTTVCKFIGPIQHAVRVSFRKSYVQGVPPLPPAYVISCANFDEASLLKRVRYLRHQVT